MIKKIRTTEYFDLFKVKENSFAAIMTDPLMMSNAGFIDLGGKVVIFDNFLSVDGARKLRELAEEITGAEQFVVINSHSHLDHYLGNCVFADSLIISSRLTREKILKNEQEIKFGAVEYQEEIAKLENQLQSVSDINQKLDIENSLIIYRNLANPDVESIAPKLTFEKELTIYGEKDNLELRAVELAHSSGDTIAVLAGEKTAFVGDLLFVGQHAFLGAGDPIKFKKELKKLLDSDLEYIIPGHGPVCGKEQLIYMIEYIDSMLELVNRYLEEPAKIKVEELPARFHHYQGPSFSWNVEFLKEYLKKSQR